MNENLYSRENHGRRKLQRQIRPRGKGARRVEE